MKHNNTLRLLINVIGGEMTLKENRFCLLRYNEEDFISIYNIACNGCMHK